MIVKKEDFTDETLKRLQLTHVEILDEVVRVCDKLGLKYFLAEGTLLGAVRHQSHIPWDDDLDIVMPREDFDCLMEACRTELSNRYYLQFSNTFDNHYLSFAKIRKKNTVINEYNLKDLNLPKEIFIDVFPLDYTNNFEHFSKKIIGKIIKAIGLVTADKVGISTASNLLQRAIVLLLKPFSLKQLNRFRKWIMTRENKRETKYYINYASFYSTSRETFEKSDFGDGVMLEFSGRQYKVPENYDSVLTRIYGDYMQLPPEEDRVLRHKPEYIDFGD